jgi:hypothetical protein
MNVHGCVGGLFLFLNTILVRLVLFFNKKVVNHSFRTSVA